MNVPTVPRRVCPGTLLAGLAVAAKQTHAIHVLHEPAGCMPWSRSLVRAAQNGGFVLVSRSVSGGLR